MKYVSSRNDSINIDPLQAMINGLSSDGGLYTPILENNEKIDINELVSLNYQDLAVKIISFFIKELTIDDIKECVYNAYDDKFDIENIVNLKECKDAYILELWHGPTSAFKDLALTLLPHLLTKAYEYKGINKTLAILTATSGDTGKAALSGFKDVKNTAVTVFYPELGVSDIQKRQMITSDGNNVKVIAVKGNFDDCQRLVKKISTSNIINDYDNVILSSANSINVGRLIPQIVYYFDAYLELVRKNKIQIGEQINFCVPTGNFGNILAGYIAKEIGLPINKLICASNSNNILTDFINTGKYDLHRDFITTISPSMDILISSNLERLLYLLYKDSNKINELMKKLNEDKAYQVEENILSEIKKDFSGYYTSEDECRQMIKDLFNNENTLIDPHTSVAYSSYLKYKNDTKDNTKTVVLSTASPYKFGIDVLDSLGYKIDNPYLALNKLEEISSMPIPSNLKDLDKLSIRFKDVIEIEDGEKTIRERLKEINDGKY